MTLNYGMLTATKCSLKFYNWPLSEKQHRTLHAHKQTIKGGRGEHTLSATSHDPACSKTDEWGRARRAHSLGNTTRPCMLQNRRMRAGEESISIRKLLPAFWSLFLYKDKDCDSLQDSLIYKFCCARYVFSYDDGSTCSILHKQYRRGTIE